jgi:hypothetical protein
MTQLGPLQFVCHVVSLESGVAQSIKKQAQTKQWPRRAFGGASLATADPFNVVPADEAGLADFSPLR